MAFNWQSLIEQESKQAYFQSLNAELDKQRENGEVIFPAQQNIFSAFELTPFEQVKVVILGQDPYHGEGQAHGLAFSVPIGIKVPPSLVNIYKELNTDISGFTTPNHGYLTHWAEQGVLLLNTVLTVKAGQAGSHAKLGWEKFTDAVIENLNEKTEGIVFILWGAHAHKKGKNINQDKHLVLKSVHPSPLSAYRGFFGCGHFSKTNQYLTEQGKLNIDWQLPEQSTQLIQTNAQRKAQTKAHNHRELTNSEQLNLL